MSKNQNSVQTEKKEQTPFYFGKKNYQLMVIGLVLIALGFILMMGPDANTVNGKLDPNAWNDDVFSIRRIRIAPLLVIAGFVVEVFAILKRNK
ncbi:hypothetical protein GCM10010992_03980 [Cloacibacterium rupense]|uniref:DUF3098 domain-containing protein n=1 Tax=Cloacibacterium rupense TaxID=517423 RepID=A0ABQ2NGR6_9FLAO|nr:DUF3098 domain-containing protein [Cloacibacterium rupense]GGP01870.1 hypothetical protein GCM10010992_03980 [Cloacibacterium rupense]